MPEVVCILPGCDVKSSRVFFKILKFNLFTKFCFKQVLKVTASTTTRSTTRRSGDQMGDQITPGDQIDDQIPTATKM